MIIPNWQAILDGAENTARVPVAPGQSVVWEIPLDEDNPFVIDPTPEGGGFRAGFSG